MITFPGHGAPGDRCGENVLRGCWDCKGYFTVLSKCMKRECPDCYTDVATRDGWSAAERLTAFLGSPDYLKQYQDIERKRWEDATTNTKSSMEERRLYRLQTYHVVVSFKDNELRDRKDIKRLRERAGTIARAHGIFGGCRIPHRRDESDPGAHVHVVGVAGYISPGLQSNDYVFKVIRFQNRWYQRSVLDRFRIVRYLVTHAVFTKRTHIVTWWGALANNKFPGARVHEMFMTKPEQPECPHCGSVATFKVVDYDHYFRESVITWTDPDRPPPGWDQRSLTEFA